MKKIKNKENKEELELEKEKSTAIDMVKPIFLKYNATSKESAMMKEEVIAEIEDYSKGPEYFKFLQTLGVIKKSGSKYYYDSKNEMKKNYSKKSIILNSILVLLVIANIIALSVKTTSKTVTVENDDVSFDIYSSWADLNDGYQEGSGWDYYRYINTKPSSTNIVNSESNTIDYEHYPARLNVYYSSSSITSLDDLKSNLETYINNEIKPSNYSIDTDQTEKGYQRVMVKLEYNGEIEYIYYLLNEDKIAYIDTFSYDTDDSMQIELNIKLISNTFQWK